MLEAPKAPNPNPNPYPKPKPKPKPNLEHAHVLEAEGGTAREQERGAPS